MNIHTPIAVLVAALIAQPAFASNGYWVWVGANGVTNFSQQKPRHHAAKHILGTGPYGYKETLEDSRRPGMAPPPPKAAPAKPSMPVQKSKSTVNPDQVIAAQKARLQAKVDALKRKNCAQARKNLKALQRPRVRVTGKDGKIHIMPPQQQRMRRKAAQKAIQDNCSD